MQLLAHALGLDGDLTRVEGPQHLQRGLDQRGAGIHAADSGYTVVRDHLNQRVDAILGPYFGRPPSFRRRPVQAQRTDLLDLHP